MAAYEADCTFSDPFVSFNGVQRFKDNVSNLGAYLYVTRQQDTHICLLPFASSGAYICVSYLEIDRRFNY
eukprot:scaffold540104_cov33-Prasinocladus_malaysianus.AAC.1